MTDRAEALGLFLAIADAGGLAAAGRRLGRSPPAMTRALSALEAQLGVRLADRSTRRFALTEAGRRLADRARRALADLDEALAEAAGEAREARGRLRVAAPLVFGRRHVAPAIAAFLDDHPAVSVDLVLSDRPADLGDENIDVAIRIGAQKDSALTQRRLGTLHRVLVASPAYLARRGAPARPADLPGHDLIVFASLAAPPEWHFAGFAFRPQARFAVNEAEAAVTAAVQGRGVLQTLSYQAAEEIADGRLIRLLPESEPPAIPVQMLFAPARPMPARLRAFVDEVAPRLATLPVLRGH